MRVITTVNNCTTPKFRTARTRLARGAAAMLAAGAAMLLAGNTLGCGNGGGANSVASGNSSSRASGRLQLTVKWPQPSRLIPAASSSIVAVLTSGTTALGNQVLVRPTKAPWTTSVTFPNLNPGAVSLTATAFPNTNGSGVAQATASAPATIIAGQQASVTVDMTSTIDHLAITPPTPTVTVNTTTSLTGTAYDKLGNIVLTATQNISWMSGTTGFATITNSGVATGVALGSSLITVTESESHKSATATLMVTAPIIAANTGPVRISVDNSGQFAYSIDQLTKTISQFKIGLNGSLTPLTPPSVTLTTVPYNLLVDPAPGSTTLWVCGSDAQVSALFQFDINANGTLSPKATPTVPSTASPEYLAVDPSAKHLYEIDENNGLRAFNVNADGSLAQDGSDVSSQQLVFSSAVAAPDGKALYVTSGGTGGIRIFQIHNDGTVSFSSSVSDIGTDIKIAPSGQYLYLCVKTGIDVYRINSDDTLSEIGTTVKFSASNYQLAITPDGRNLYSIAQLAPDNEVAQYAINADGSLTPHTPPTVLAGNDTTGISVTPNGKYVYVVNTADSTVSLFLINADGTLSPASPPTVPG